MHPLSVWYCDGFLVDTLCIFSASFLTEGGGGHANIHICIRGHVVIQGYVQ